MKNKIFTVGDRAIAKVGHHDVDVYVLSAEGVHTKIESAPFFFKSRRIHSLPIYGRTD